MKTAQSFLILSVTLLFYKAACVGNIGFIGLGAMGKHMACHLHAKVCSAQHPLLVWNRTPERSKEHHLVYGTRPMNSLQETSECSLLFLSLPTTTEVSDVLSSCPLKEGTIVVDCTSGDPALTRSLCESLAYKGIILVDCPVSGGPAGAAAATLTTMIGGNDDAAIETVKSVVLKSFSSKAVHCGVSGSGMAVKSINNILNTAHLLVAAEGLLALQAFGVDPDTALEVINSSSGRSLATQERIPNSVLTGQYNYGFKLGLMAKDCRIASSLVADFFPHATILPEANRLINTAEKMPWGFDADYTEVVKLLENKSSTELRRKH
jgi:3-hydroxyisobutyrate dehydrogenase